MSRRISTQQAGQPAPRVADGARERCGWRIVAGVKKCRDESRHSRLDSLRHGWRMELGNGAGGGLSRARRSVETNLDTAGWTACATGGGWNSGEVRGRIVAGVKKCRDESRHSRLDSLRHGWRMELGNGAGGGLSRARRSVETNLDTAGWTACATGGGWSSGEVRVADCCGREEVSRRISTQQAGQPAPRVADGARERCGGRIVAGVKKCRDESRHGRLDSLRHGWRMELGNGAGGGLLRARRSVETNLDTAGWTACATGGGWNSGEVRGGLLRARRSVETNLDTAGWTACATTVTGWRPATHSSMPMLGAQWIRSPHARLPTVAR